MDRRIQQLIAQMGDQKKLRNFTKNRLLKSKKISNVMRSIDKQTNAWRIEGI